jgi:hypothetical protein
VEYIAAKFGNVGLMPYGDNATYLQAFTFKAEPVLGPANTMQLGRKKLKLGEQVLSHALLGQRQPRAGKIYKVGYGIQRARAEATTTTADVLDRTASWPSPSARRMASTRTASTWPTTT